MRVLTELGITAEALAAETCRGGVDRYRQHRVANITRRDVPWKHQRAAMEAEEAARAAPHSGA
jgi:hypothetical protein